MIFLFTITDGNVSISTAESQLNIQSLLPESMLIAYRQAPVWLCSRKRLSRYEIRKPSTSVCRLALLNVDGTPGVTLLVKQKFVSYTIEKESTLPAPTNQCLNGLNGLNGLCDGIIQSGLDFLDVSQVTVFYNHYPLTS